MISILGNIYLMIVNGVIFYMVWEWLIVVIMIKWNNIGWKIGESMWLYIEVLLFVGDKLLYLFIC